MHEKRPTSVLAYASYRNNLYYNINTKSDVDSLTKISRLVSRTKNVDMSVFQLPFMLIKNHIICISNDKLIIQLDLYMRRDICSYVNNSECFLSRAELIRQLLFFDWQD